MQSTARRKQRYGRGPTSPSKAALSPSKISARPATLVCRSWRCVACCHHAKYWLTSSGHLLNALMHACMLADYIRARRYPPIHVQNLPTYPPAAEGGMLSLSWTGATSCRPTPSALHLHLSISGMLWRAGTPPKSSKVKQSSMLPQTTQPLRLACPCLEPASIRSSYCWSACIPGRASPCWRPWLFLICSSWHELRTVLHAFRCCSSLTELLSSVVMKQHQGHKAIRHS